LREYRSQTRAETGREKGKDKEKERPSQPIVGRGGRYRENRGPRFTRYTPLNVDREELWMRP